MHGKGATEDGAFYKGLRVLDVAQGFAGPYCGSLLAAQGADVVKVEPPGGDWARRTGRQIGNNTAFGLVPNLNKRGVCIDATTKAGRDVLRRLALAADVVIQNFRPGVPERLGIGERQLRPAAPDLVYVSISGFGEDGPWAGRPATDTILQGFAGLMTLNRDSAGTPRRVDFSLIDVAAGVYAAQRAGAALYRRATGGGGAHIRLSLLEVATALQAAPLLDQALVEAGAGGSQQPLGVPLGMFATADGYVNLSCISDRMFAGICRAIGRIDWLEDPRFAAAKGRLAHAAEITAGVVAALRVQPTASWVEAFAREDVLCGPVQDHAALLSDPQARAARLFGRLSLPGLSATVPVACLPGEVRDDTSFHRVPELGEHTTEVLREHGYTGNEIAELAATGAIYCAVSA